MQQWAHQMSHQNNFCMRQSLRFRIINVRINNRNISENTYVLLYFLYFLEKRMSYLLDKEDEETVVEDSFEGFQQMYQPII